MDILDLAAAVIPNEKDDDFYNPGPNARYCERCQDFKMFAVLRQSTGQASTSTPYPTCPECGSTLVLAEI